MLYVCIIKIGRHISKIAIENIAPIYSIIKKVAKKVKVVLKSKTNDRIYNKNIMEKIGTYFQSQFSICADRSQ